MLVITTEYPKGIKLIRSNRDGGGGEVMVDLVLINIPLYFYQLKEKTRFLHFLVV